MGNLCCCVKSQGYEAIDGDADMAPSSVNPTPHKDKAGSSSVADTKEDAFQFAENSPVFQGTVVDQKFSNKSSYDQKFAWVNLNSKTLNLSEHMTKERRHKEASLSDVMSVVAGPPEKYKLVAGESGLDESKCMSVKFVRGGGIDMKFHTNEQRDSWYNVILHLVLKQDGSQNFSSANTN